MKKVTFNIIGAFIDFFCAAILSIIALALFTHTDIYEVRWWVLIPTTALIIKTIVLLSINMRNNPPAQNGEIHKIGE